MLPFGRLNGAVSDGAVRAAAFGRRTRRALRRRIPSRVGRLSLKEPFLAHELVRRALLSLASAALALTIAAGAYGAAVSRGAATRYADYGLPQRVLLDAKNGERRDDFTFSFARFADLGRSPQGTLRYFSLLPLSSGHSYLRADFMFAWYGHAGGAARITDAYVEDGAGQKSAPLAATYCDGGQRAGATIELPRATPCNATLLFSAPSGAGPYRLWVTYVEQRPAGR